MILGYLKRILGLNRLSPKRKQEVIGLLMLLIALLTLGSLTSNSTGDELYFQPGSTLSIDELNPENSVGYAGMVFSHFAYQFFGLLSFFVPVWFGLWGLRLLFKWDNEKYFKRFYYASGLFFAISTLVALSAVNPPLRNVNYVSTLGGLMSHLVASLLSRIFGSVGTVLICIAAGLIFLSLLIDWRPRKWEQKARAIPGRIKSRFGSLFEGYGISRNQDRSRATDDGPPLSIWQRIKGFNLDFLRPSYEEKCDEPQEPDSSYVRSKTPPPSENFAADIKKIQEAALKREEEEKKAGKMPKKKTSQNPQVVETQAGEYVYPSLDLLEDNPQPVQSVTSSELQQTADDLLRTLKTFGVEVEGGKIEKYPGPVITRFEFKPGLGIKVNQIVNLSDDLALALRAKRIRIIAPVPGKAAVGIEIPNRNPQMVYLKDILESDDYGDSSVRLPMALGRTTSGEPFVADLAAMPHLLVAGATGSGKSVCLNVLITSLIYRHDPTSLRFLLIDPKMLELSVYKGLPHLERPVVTTPRKAESLLNDAVGEMESRYKKLASENVRNIQDYNTKVGDANKLPYIVIMVDELADLMMSNTSTRTETLITRLAQMARAVGIHLVLATQRPSVDVITGLIKANFPARLAFQVATRIDSRTILDGNGAEKLLGHGDLLFLEPGQPEPVRIHGAYVSSLETTALMEHMKEQQVEIPKLNNFTEETSAQRQADLGTDPLLKEAAELVVRHKQGSVSLLQRRLGIGYQRAARLIDQLEEKKIVGVYDGSKAREVLVDELYLGTLLKND
ncbi:MAG: DNA translocase FtsK [Candidatus Zixiibacteriota bacterium]